MRDAAASNPKTVRVNLGDRSYDIYIGPDVMGCAGDVISHLLPGARCAIITDTNVDKILGDKLRHSLDGHSIKHTTISIEPGEKSKSMTVFSQVVDRLLEERFERSDALIALGGGVVGDLGGYVAASMRRGMKFVQIPTSLLAQVDSSVGGKTGINSPHGKNLIGAFYQPAVVIADTHVLSSLSRREFAAGYAEVAKYGLINDPEFFKWLEQNHLSIFDRGDALTQAVAISCQAKADVVAADEQEAGCRALLNLGHTFGHALEGATGYQSERLVHGEGVSIGITLAHEFSNRMNLCSVETVERVEAHFNAVGLPTSISDIPGELPDGEKLLEYISQDKKVKRGALTFILTRGVGKSFIADDVPSSQVLAFLKEKHR